MTRILINVEGETEEGFVNNLLAPHLYSLGYQSVSARLIGNSRARSRRGGIRSWQETKSDLLRHLKSSNEVIVGLMVDYYALPADWPNRVQSNNAQFEQKANMIETAIHSDVCNSMHLDFNPTRFVPLVMMHEFEALLFSDCEKFAEAIGLDIKDRLQQVLDLFGDPEKINDSQQTAPSKRIKNIVPKYQKPLYGNVIAMDIGLPTIRTKCTHFNEWVTQLENIQHQ